MDKPLQHLLVEVIQRVRMLEAAAVMEDGELPEAVMVYDERPSDILASALSEIVEQLCRVLAPATA